jgi:hypothetical protein
MRFLIGLMLCAAAASLTAVAQTLRDPTQAPDGAGLAANASSGPKAAGVDGTAFTIIVRDGIPSLVVDTRLYTRGQKLGNTTIERITETEVWLREGRVLRKLSQFQGIERRPASPTRPAAASRTAAKSCTTSSPSSSSSASTVSCASVKP